MPRKHLASYGRRRFRVNLFVARGLVCCEWRVRGQRRTKSWPDSPKTREVAKLWAEDYADERRRLEQDRAAAAAVRANLATTRLADRASVRDRDVSAYLDHGVEGDRPFDLVFLDPPYALDPQAIDAFVVGLSAPGILSPGWTVVLTRGHKGPLPAVPLDWAVARQLRYGDSLLTLYREVGWS